MLLPVDPEPIPPILIIMLLLDFLPTSRWPVPTPVPSDLICWLPLFFNDMVGPDAIGEPSPRGSPNDLAHAITGLCRRVALATAAGAPDPGPVFFWPTLLIYVIGF